MAWIVDDANSGKLGDHQNHPSVDGDDAWVGRHFFYQRLFVRALRENGDSGGPDDDAHRDKIKGCVQKAHAAVQPLGDGISHKSGVGADGGILQDLLFLSSVAVVQCVAENRVADLYHNRNHQGAEAFSQNLPAHLDHKRCNDVAGNNDIKGHVC